MPKKPIRIALVLAVLFVAACVTVNIYFPAAKVQKAAEKIVDDVYKQGLGSGETAGSGDETSCLQYLWSLVTPSEARADEVTEVSNASIRALKSEIATHTQQMAAYYKQGNIGIRNDGYLEIRSTDGLPLRDVAAVRRLVDADNESRKKLYTEVANALNISGDQVSRVATIFAGQWQEKAPTGWWVQDQSGNWRQR